MFLHCSPIHWSYSRGLLLWSPQTLTLYLWNLASKYTEIHTKPQLKTDLIWPVLLYLQSKIKEKKIKHQFSQSLVLQKDFIYEIQSLIFTYHEIAFDCSTLNAKDIHKGENMAWEFGLMYFNFMLNTEEMGSVYV